MSAHARACSARAAADCAAGGVNDWLVRTRTGTPYRHPVPYAQEGTARAPAGVAPRTPPSPAGMRDAAAGPDRACLCRWFPPGLDSYPALIPTAAQASGLGAGATAPLEPSEEFPGAGTGRLHTLIEPAAMSEVVARVKARGGRGYVGGS